MKPLVAYRFVATERLVAEALARVLWPVAVNRVAVVVARVVVPTTLSVPLVRRFPLAAA